MNNPQIEKLPNGVGGRRFRVTGGDIAENWSRSIAPGKTAWCEMTVSPESYSDGTRTGNWLVTCYGGEVWPSAWPHLFIGSHTVRVTEAGKQLLGLD